MANIKSQIKRNKTNEKARLRNKAQKSAVATAMKAVKVAVDAKDSKAAAEKLVLAFSLIDKAVSDGVYHKNTGARKKSEISKLVNSIK